MIDDVDELLALRAGDKYRLNDIRRRLEIYKRLYISDLEFLRNLAKAYLGKDLSPEPRRPRPGRHKPDQALAQAAARKWEPMKRSALTVGQKRQPRKLPRKLGNQERKRKPIHPLA